MTTTDTSFGYKRAVKLQTMTQETRHAIITHILSHPRGLPSLFEINNTLPASNSTIYRHLTKLEDKQIIARYKLPESDYPRNAPRVFYGMTPTGYSIVQESTVFEDVSALQADYDPPAEVEDYEPLPRPPSARSLTDLEQEL